MDYSALGIAAAEHEALNSTSLVKGRVLQADADFFAYECASIDHTLAYAIKRVKSHIEVKRHTAGAEFINLHLTLGMKGGREQMATVSPYQEKRNANRDPKLSKRVAELRSFMATYKTKTVKPVVNLYQEADDSMTQMQHEQIAKHGIESSVIMSGDKDLWMSYGKHVDPKTGKFYTVTGYGKCEYRDVGNTTLKLVGEGTSWFWHQLVMGDKADNIPGLPKLSGRLCERYIPLKRPNPKRKALGCGEAKAVAMLKDCHSNTEAAKRVMEAYQDHYGMIEGASMLVEQAFLLWMRRTRSPLDVLTFLKESGLNVSFNQTQKDALKRYKSLVELQQKRAKAETLDL